VDAQAPVSQADMQPALHAFVKRISASVSGQSSLTRRQPAYCEMCASTSKMQMPRSWMAAAHLGSKPVFRVPCQQHMYSGTKKLGRNAHNNRLEIRSCLMAHGMRSSVVFLSNFSVRCDHAVCVIAEANTIYETM
jgi:hypothetical protein